MHYANAACSLPVFVPEVSTEEKINAEQRRGVRYENAASFPAFLDFSWVATFAKKFGITLGNARHFIRQGERKGLMKYSGE